jgi:hypothetical protein
MYRAPDAKRIRLTDCEEMLSSTSTKFVPWYVIPADQKPITHMLVATILASEIQQRNLANPILNQSQHEALIACRARLEAEVV